MELGVGKSERGWEMTFDGIFGPEEEQPFFATEGEAKEFCERTAAEWRQAERSGATVDGAGFDSI